MKKTILMLSLMILHGIVLSQNNTSESKKILQDKEAIKKMEGCYKVTFEFAETFSPLKDYQYHDRKFDWGIEYVFVIEETDKLVSLQHLLIVNDTTIVKHWRQDWIYENDELLVFHKNNEWRKVKLSPDKQKGTWTQKVYQVDDSPRYEGFGTWNHVDDRHFWQSTTDAPLPRREFTKRSDYNVLKRHSKIEITSYGWILEQDNEKIKRENGIDELICWEKGFEKFQTGNYNCQAAIDWWNKHEHYWKDVREIWSTVLKNQKNKVVFQSRVNEKLMFESLFELGKQNSNTKDYNSKEVRTSVKKTIESYLIN